MFTERDGDLIADDGRIQVRFSGNTGGIATVRNLVTGQLIVDREDPVPWRMPVQGRNHRWLVKPNWKHFSTPDALPVAFRFTIDDDGRRAELRWDTTDPGLTLVVRAVPDVGGGIALWPHLIVEEGARPPSQLAYPIFEGPGELSAGGSGDRLVFPGHAGWLISHPKQIEALDAPYPDGYMGASMQFMAYFAEGVGGVYLANHDPHSTAKHIRFSADEMAFDHEAWDIRRGADLDLDYPIVIDALVVGDWYEAADRYRAWALPNAPWCRDHAGNAIDPGRDGARWLFDETGFSIWCTPARIDWAQWYRHYAEIAGTPLHIVPAWDWPETLPPSRGDHGVFPATFHPNNVEAWEGHRVTPYLNDLFVSSRAPDFFERWEPNLLFPYVTFPWPPFSEPALGWVDGEAPGPDPETTTNYDFFLCPVTEAQVELHAWRDKILADEYGMDGVFYDISTGNTWPWSRCLRVEHGHAPGRGRQIVQAYEEMNRRSKEAAAAATGRYFTQGTEVVQEPMIGSVDFYVSRACAGPLGLLETSIFGPETPPGGGRELIPLFQAVYHDVGPVHEDGWITLAEDEGTFFFFVAARIALIWGGILSLQYCTVPPEAFEGQDLSQPAETILWDAALVRWDTFPTADAAKEEFVRELATARTGFANAYLAYGKMLRPPHVTTTPIELDWHQSYYGWGTEGWRNDGAWAVPDVMVSAWRGPDNSIGVVFVNLHRDKTVTRSLQADIGSVWGSDHAGTTVRVRTAAGVSDAGTVSDDNRLSLEVDLEPRRVTVVEIGIP
jgi:hypothetical protein